MCGAIPDIQPDPVLNFLYSQQKNSLLHPFCHQHDLYIQMHDTKNSDSHFSYPHLLSDHSDHKLRVGSNVSHCTKTATVAIKHYKRLIEHVSLFLISCITLNLKLSERSKAFIFTDWTLRNAS